MNELVFEVEQDWRLLGGHHHNPEMATQAEGKVIKTGSFES
jgi:hypothetical protein